MRPMRLLLEGRGGGGRRRFHLLLLLLEQLLVLLLPRLRSSEILIVDGVTTVLRRREGRVLRVDLLAPPLHSLAPLLMLMLVLDRRHVGFVTESLVVAWHRARR